MEEAGGVLTEVIISLLWLFLSLLMMRCVSWEGPLLGERGAGEKEARLCGDRSGGGKLLGWLRVDTMVGFPVS